MKTLIGLAFPLIFAIPLHSQAIDCGDRDPKTATDRASDVFIGKIVADANVPTTVKVPPDDVPNSIVGYEIAVERALKGKVGKRVAVFTKLAESPFSFPSGSGNPADQRRRFLVFAQRATEAGGLLLIPKCSGTQDVYGAGYFLSHFGIGERLREVKNTSLQKRQAPGASLRAFRTFFDYVKRGKPDIVEDTAAQTRFLSKSLRTNLTEYAKSLGDPENHHDYPSNAFFLGVWNKPTTFSIVDSRYYLYANKKNPNARRVMIDVLYEWGHEETLDNQYPGVRNLRTYCLIFEEGAWKLDDIYGFQDEFTSAESFLQFLKNRH